MARMMMMTGARLGNNIETPSSFILFSPFCGYYQRFIRVRRMISFL